VSELNWRKFEEELFKALMATTMVFIIGVLLVIIVTVVAKGISSLSLSMLIEPPRNAAREGGILNAILGSLYLASGATLIAFTLALPTAIYVNEYGGRSKFANYLRLSLDLLSGVPSVVFGFFGFILFVLWLSMGISLLAGMLTLAVLELPLMARSIELALSMVPSELREASYALGATKFETILNVVLHQALPGIITAVLISFARGISEAAPVLFTAQFSDFIPYSLFAPSASLPLAVYFYISYPYESARAKAYVASLILIVIVLTINVTLRALSKRFMKYIVR